MEEQPHKSPEESDSSGLFRIVVKAALYLWVLHIVVGALNVFGGLAPFMGIVLIFLLIVGWSSELTPSIKPDFILDKDKKD